MNFDPVELCLELVGIPSESRNEEKIADFIEMKLGALSHLVVRRIKNNVVVQRRDLERPSIILAGHVDTVPASSGYGVYMDGDRIFGVGSSDMKGGIAVMMTLAADPDNSSPVRYVFYACEEIDRLNSGLLEIEREYPGAFDAEVALLMEPTQNIIEAGCQGTLRAKVHIGGQRAHTARPHMGVNAIHRSAGFIEVVSSQPQRTVLIDSCEFREALSVVKITGGVANNVVPDGAELLINYRFAPDVTVEAAVEFISTLFVRNLRSDLGDSISIEEFALPAPPSLDNPFLAKLALLVQKRRGKLGWTDVSFFHERGIPATNFGPGDPEVAHAAGEWIEASEILHSLEILRSLFTEWPKVLS